MYLSIQWFLSTEDAKEKVINWVLDCNDFRPHSSLAYKTPSKFALETVDVSVFFSHINYEILVID